MITAGNEKCILRGVGIVTRLILFYTQNKTQPIVYEQLCVTVAVIRLRDVQKLMAG